MVIAGSQNWSEAGARTNDETLVVVENSAIAAHFQREFDRLISTAMLGIPRRVQAKIDQLREDCLAR